MFFFSFFSRMPELHINGRFHYSSLENSDFETSYDTSSSFTVTKLSQNSTIAFITPTNSMDSENLFCGIVFVIIYFCFGLIIMIVIEIWIIWKRRMMETRKSQESNESPLNCMRNCNWTKYPNDYHIVIQCSLKEFMTSWMLCWKMNFVLDS